MASEVSGGGVGPLSPDEAFAVLGNETRVHIIQTLGEADKPLTFTELRNRVGIRQGGQFNYHLDKLLVHFVDKSDEGYALRQAGRRVVEAVLSGALTADPELEPTEIDFTCRLCGAPVRLGYSKERVELYCTGCSGHYGTTAKTRESIVRGEHGILGGFSLPPAGVEGRTADEILMAASTWGHLESIAMANDVCPRCSAIVEHSISVCEEHDPADGLCDGCDRRHAVQIHSRCSNCRYDIDGMIVNYLVGSPDLRAFVTARGIDPISEGVRWGWEYDEKVLSVEPFEARFTFTIDGDAITLTVDDELSVIEVTAENDPFDATERSAALPSDCTSANPHET